MVSASAIQISQKGEQMEKGNNTCISNPSKNARFAFLVEDRV